MVPSLAHTMPVEVIQKLATFGGIQVMIDMIP
jgi:hypothetical protein